MIFANNEAQTKWCPMSAAQAENEGCKGEHCAAWRWKTKKTNFPPKGYCGLAGPVELDHPSAPEQR